MRQSSLLDSFIKRANNSQDTGKKQNPKGQTNTQNVSSIKENDKKINPVQINDEPQKPLYFSTAQKTNSHQQQPENVYKPEKIQIQYLKPKNELSDDSQSPQLRKAKPKDSNAKQPQSRAKSVKSKSAKNKKQRDGEDYDLQVNSESQQLFSGDPEENSESFQDNDNDDEFQRRQKRKPVSKKTATKSQKKKIQPSKSFVSQNKIQPVKNPQEMCEDTLIFDRSKFTDATPQWAIPGNIKCKDKYGISCRDPDYDETTLQVPEYLWKDFSGPMKQYWKIKSQNFDKIIFFKLGKFYELFYEDALMGNQLLDLKWMGTKMHVGFPEKSLDRYTHELVRQGIKVVVVEQMQTPEQMNNRIQAAKQKGIKTQKTLNRQVTQIITKGTFQQQSEQVYLPNYLMTIYRYQEYTAYTLLEIGTNSILMGIVEGFEEFKTILYQTRPAEIVYDPDNLPKEWVQIMKENIDNMILTKLMNKQNLWHHLNATNQITQLEEKKVIKKPKIIETIQKFDTVPRNLMISTLSGLFDYLHRIYKFEYVLSTAKFKFYEKEKALSHMVLDSQALQHLQVFQTAAGELGSLFQKIDRTKSKFGKRLFRRWMTSPLLSTCQINQRLDAVSDLKEIGTELQRVQSSFGKLLDLEKMCNKLYKYSVANTAAASAVYFSDLNMARLQEFDQFMKSIEQSMMIFKLLQDHKQHFKSKRLRELITLNAQFEHQNCPEKLIYFQDEEFDENQNSAENQRGLLPDIIGHLQSFKQYIIWKEGKPTPKEGIISLYDSLLKTEKEIKRKLDQQLEKIRMAFKCPSICYMHVKQRYEVEIPQRKDIKIPKEFSFSSRKAGYSRYLVSQVQEIVTELQVVQKSIKTQMSIFVTFFFEQFKQKQNVWERYINILAELDCFCSMAQYSKQRKTCRPVFVEEGYQVVDGVHPSLYSIDFVPNDISFKDPIILLTGPNMGGKSTILRTSCLLAIMAQMGCYVPCRSYKASIIDRIFTRIGASDKLESGKSTFFIEMEQTKSIVNHATNRSLAIIDELGRGTATYDGMALAHSVLNFIITKINCKCFFATHYHSLTEEFASMPGTCLKMMDYEILKGEQDRIDFLYKLVNGKAQKSFGLNVAQLVGLPKQLIQAARIKSDQMHEQIEKKKKKIKVYEILDQIFGQPGIQI